MLIQIYRRLNTSTVDDNVVQVCQIVVDMYHKHEHTKRMCLLYNKERLKFSKLDQKCSQMNICNTIGAIMDLVSYYRRNLDVLF